jgi:hypothetical protein
MFASAQLLRNWLGQRFSNQDDLDSSITGRLASLLRGGRSAPSLIFVPKDFVFVGLRFVLSLALC